MRKNEISEQLARESHLSKAVAADRVDRVVHDIMKRLRKGEAVSMPGLGKLSSPRRSRAFIALEKRPRAAAKAGPK